MALLTNNIDLDINIRVSFGDSDSRLRLFSGLQFDTAVGLELRLGSEVLFWTIV